jgi:hypothetical protein
MYELLEVGQLQICYINKAGCMYTEHRRLKVKTFREKVPRYVRPTSYHKLNFHAKIFHGIVVNICMYVYIVMGSSYLEYSPPLLF